MQWRRKSKGTKQYREREAAVVAEMRKLWNEPQPVPKLDGWLGHGRSSIDPEPFGDTGHRVVKRTGAKW